VRRLSARINAARRGKGRRSNSCRRLLGDRQDVQRLPQIDLGGPKLRPSDQDFLDKRLLARRRNPNRKLREIIARRQPSPKPRLRALDLCASPADRISRPLGHAPRRRQPVRLRHRHDHASRKSPAPHIKEGRGLSGSGYGEPSPDHRCYRHLRLGALRSQSQKAQGGS
jgi:hypothetical protein